jgi:hypothetical protein
MQPVTPANREKPLFHDESATVTPTRAILGGTTYAVANITSVRHQEQPGEMGLTLFGLCVAIVGLLLLDAYMSPAIGLVAFGLVVVVIGVKIRKPKHWVLVCTAGAETRAVFSYDKHWTTKVVEALNQAIIDRG